MLVIRLSSRRRKMRMTVTDKDGLITLSYHHPLPAYFYADDDLSVIDMIEEYDNNGLACEVLAYYPGLSCPDGYPPSHYRS